MNGKNKLFRHGIFLLIMLMAVILLVIPSTVMAQNDDNDDQIVLGGRFRLHSDETINGNLIILGGAAVLEADSLVQGDVLITGGSLEAAGRAGALHHRPGDPATHGWSAGPQSGGAQEHESLRRPQSLRLRGR